MNSETIELSEEVVNRLDAVALRALVKRKADDECISFEEKKVLAEEEKTRAEGLPYWAVEDYNFQKSGKYYIVEIFESLDKMRACEYTTA